MNGYAKLQGVPKDYISDIRVISSDNRLVVSCWDGSLSLFDITQQQLLMKLQHSWPLTSCHVSKDGRIWAGSVQGEVLEADWESERLIPNDTVSFSLGISGITSIDHFIIVSSWDGSLIVLDYLRNQIVKQWKFEKKIFQLCASEERVICSLSSGKVKLIQFPSWDITETESGLKYQCRSCTLIPNNRGFVQGSVDGRVSVEFFDDQSPKFAFRCHRMNLEDVQMVFPVTALAFQPNSLNLFTGGADGKIVSWNLVSRKKQEEFHKLDDTIVKLCCTEDYLVIAVSDDSFKTCTVPQDIELHPSAIYIKHL